MVGWLPPTEEDQALWHVVHLDGDEEDLDEEELLEALLEESADQSLPANSSNNSTEAVAAVAAAEDPGPQPLPTLPKPSEEQEDRAEDMEVEETAASEKEQEEDKAGEEPVFVPAIVKKSSGLSRSNYHSRGVVSGLFGLGGLSQECQRFLNIITENLKKKAGARFGREEKKILDQRLRNAEDLSDLKDLLLELEDLVHCCQSKADRREKEESALAKEDEKREMMKDGWIFDSKLCEEIGRKGRRFFSQFGVSDGVIVAMLPAEKNDGIALFRMIHNDGDKEDLDEEDLLAALRYFELNLTEAEIRAELREKRSGAEREMDEEEEDDEDNDEDDDDILMDSSSETSEGLYNEEGLLWPTLEVRERWVEAVKQSRTVGELSLALTALEENTFNFGLFGEPDPVFPLTLFTSYLDPEAAKLLAQAATQRYPQRERGAVQHYHHEALSPRKAKKRAISEISRCRREENTPVDEDSEEPRRSKRVANNQIHSTNSSSSNLQFYNSGRPSRTAAQKPVNYAV